MPKVTCPCCDGIELAALPIEQIKRAGEVGMTIPDLLNAANKAHATCCSKGAMAGKSSILPSGLMALIQEIEALIAVFVPGA